MKKAILLVIMLSTIVDHASAQLMQVKQRDAAETCLNLILKGEKEEIWQMFDTVNVPNVNRGQFESALMQIKKGLTAIDTFVLSSNIAQEVNHKIMYLYRYKAVSKTTHILNDEFVDMTFFDTSKLIGGIQLRLLPKDSTSLTSKGKETPLVKPFDAVIDGVSYRIRGINIVHFDDNVGLLAIQVERNISSDEFNKQEWTTIEAKKFAKFLVAENYVAAAKGKAAELGLKLVEDLGVSFVNPGTKNGINVKLTPAQFK